MAKTQIQPGTIARNKDFDAFVDVLRKVAGDVPVTTACTKMSFNRSKFYRWLEALTPEEEQATNHAPLSASSLAEAVLNALDVSKSIVHESASQTATH